MTTKRLKHLTNFESLENVRSSNVVEFECELRHIPITVRHINCLRRLLTWNDKVGTEIVREITEIMLETTITKKQLGTVSCLFTCSASLSSLTVRYMWLSTIGNRTFHVATADVWNSLKQHVTSAPSLGIFLKRLSKAKRNVTNW